MKTETLKPGWYYRSIYATTGLRLSYEFVATMPVLVAVLTEAEFKLFEDNKDHSMLPDKPLLHGSGSRRVDGKAVLLFSYPNNKIKGINVNIEEAVIGYEVDATK